MTVTRKNEDHHLTTNEGKILPGVGHGDQLGMQALPTFDCMCLDLTLVEMSGRPQVQKRPLLHQI